MINKKLFTNADLNGSYQLVYTHNLNTQDLIPTLFDGSSIQAITADNFALGDETGNNKDNIVTLSMNNPITGTWKLLLSYQSGAETTSGRRAFEFTTGTPDDDSRLVYGKVATPSLNITFAGLYSLLLTKLGFLKKDENLNDLPDKSQARTNLGVYSTTAVDNAISDKASLYQSGSGAVLGVANTAVYTPTAQYHPATKGYTDALRTYVDSLVGSLLLTKGSQVIGDIPTEGARYTVSLGITLANTNYFVDLEFRADLGSSQQIGGYTIEEKNTNSFKFLVYKNGSTVTNYTIYYRIYPL